MTSYTTTKAFLIALELDAVEKALRPLIAQKRLDDALPLLKERDNLVAEYQRLTEER